MNGSIKMAVLKWQEAAAAANCCTKNQKAAIITLQCCKLVSRVLKGIQNSNKGL